MQAKADKRKGDNVDVVESLANTGSDRWSCTNAIAAYYIIFCRVSRKISLAIGAIVAESAATVVTAKPNSTDDDAWMKELVAFENRMLFVRS